jgi:Glycerol-3-phosphate dehydrogenase
MEIGIIGCGRWGSFIAWYLNHIGHNVALYGRESSERMKTLMKTRKNQEIELPEEMKLTTSLEEICEKEIIVISVNSQGLRALFTELQGQKIEGKPIILCMKGIEIGTGKRLSEIAKEKLPENPVAVWLGPGHVQEFFGGVPNCMVIDSEDVQMKEQIVEAFSSELIRFYFGQDLIGNEIGAAAKNVIGIAAGMLDGLSLSSLKGALMSRGTREIARLIKALGGNELSAYGLCHLGDYEATVFSKYSHNRKFGEMLVRGEKYPDLAEGYYTAKAIMLLAEKTYCALPICAAVYSVLYEEKDARETLDKLFSRSLKTEF